MIPALICTSTVHTKSWKCSSSYHCYELETKGNIDSYMYAAEKIKAAVTNFSAELTNSTHFDMEKKKDTIISGLEQSGILEYIS